MPVQSSDFLSNVWQYILGLIVTAPPLLVLVFAYVNIPGTFAKRALGAVGCAMVYVAVGTPFLLAVAAQGVQAAWTVSVWWLFIASIPLALMGGLDFLERKFLSKHDDETGTPAEKKAD